jgi:hypothetical protein
MDGRLEGRQRRNGRKEEIELFALPPFLFVYFLRALLSLLLFPVFSHLNLLRPFLPFPAL